MRDRDAGQPLVALVAEDAVGALQQPPGGRTRQLLVSGVEFG
jgi:hypothetical protein